LAGYAISNATGVATFEGRAGRYELEVSDGSGQPVMVDLDVKSDGCSAFNVVLPICEEGLLSVLAFLSITYLMSYPQSGCFVETRPQPLPEAIRCFVGTAAPAGAKLAFFFDLSCQRFPVFSEDLPPYFFPKTIKDGARRGGT